MSVGPDRFLTPHGYEEAAELMANYGEDARVVGGGQSLSILLRTGLVSPIALMSLRDCPEAHQWNVDDKTAWLGARATIMDLNRQTDAKKLAPWLSSAAGLVASPPIRAFGTVVGNLCHCDPGSDLFTPLICSGASICAISVAGERRIAVEEFVLGPYESALEPNEFAGGLSVPRLDGWTGCYQKVAWRGADHPVVSLCVAVLARDGKVVDARVSLGAAIIVPRRLAAVERTLIGVDIDCASTAVEDECRRDLESVDLIDDHDVPASYRASVIPRLLANSVREALTEREAAI